MEGNIREAQSLIILEAERRPHAEDRMLPAEAGDRSGKGQNGLRVFVGVPGDPAHGIVLAPGIVVAVPGVEDLIAFTQKGRALGQEEQGQEIADLLQPQHADIPPGRAAFIAAVPAEVFRGSVAAALSVVIVVLFVISDQVGQGKTFITGHIADLPVGRFHMQESVHEIPHDVIIALDKAAEQIPVIVIIFGQSRSIGTAGPVFIRVGPADLIIGKAVIKDGCTGQDRIGGKGRDGGNVSLEPEPVHMIAGHIEAGRLQLGLRGNGFREAELEDHADPRPVQGIDHLREFPGRTAGSGQLPAGGQVTSPAVAPVIGIRAVGIPAQGHAERIHRIGGRGFRDGPSGPGSAVGRMPLLHGRDSRSPGFRRIQLIDREQFHVGHAQRLQIGDLISQAAEGTGIRRTGAAAGCKAFYMEAVNKTVRPGQGSLRPVQFGDLCLFRYKSADRDRSFRRFQEGQLPGAGIDHGPPVPVIEIGPLRGIQRGYFRGIETAAAEVIRKGKDCFFSVGKMIQDQAAVRTAGKCRAADSVILTCCQIRLYAPDRCHFQFSSAHSPPLCLSDRFSACFYVQNNGTRHEEMPLFKFLFMIYAGNSGSVPGPFTAG